MNNNSLNTDLNKIHNLKEIKEKGYDHPAGGGSKRVSNES